MKTEVRAAGGVVRRAGRHGPEFALVHRARYDDWTFPKGKAEDGESDEVSAEREVREETGFVCERGPEVVSVRYADRRGRPKTVRYWLMYPVGGAFAPNDEVDDLRWLDADSAAALLTYGHDKNVLADARSFDRPVYLVRHAKAGDREAWSEDDVLRPVTRKGRAQAEGLVMVFRQLPVDLVLSSPYVRCVQTVRPLAIARSVPLEEHDALAEGTPTADALSLVRSRGGAVVMCSHGDVVPAVVRALAEHGVDMLDPPIWKKGSTWMLERDGGLFTSARYLGLPPSAP
ncbi:MAG TPA: NUDIX hydrolase [Actinomycetota bacterium]|nr:NUDIX hydrolase [Actinomycetota bacterium]